MSINLNLVALPLCQKCGEGRLLPLEDAQQNGEAYLKAWVCSNPKCNWNIVQRAGYLNIVDVLEFHAPDR